MLSSTITKPTTISPTAQCHYKIKVVESINIAPLPAPKPRTVSLEAVPKKSKPKRPVKDTQTGVPKLSQNDERLPDATALSPSGDPPLSPAPSEISSTSATSGSSVSWQLRSTSSIGRHPNIDKERSNPAAAHGISASIEVLRGGCLPGDTLPVQIFVSHGKAIKSLQGIIITLYRLARIDTHPAIPLGTSREGEKPEYEDYYPKSRTGLGGLSLSSAGSCRSFRQDLNQVFAPLIVDPRSLTASVRSSIKVPEDLFPTINTVPGQMISFKYYVEVVVDLRGKLAGQDRVRSQLGIVNGAAGYGNGDPKVSGVNGSSGLVFPLASGFGCLDTSQIRRERSVVSWPFQLVVGTRDSDRKRGKQGEDFQASEMTQPGPPAAITRGSTGSVDLETNPRHTGELIADQRTSGIQFQVPEHSGDSPQYTDVAQVYTIPPPEPEETVDEKPRLRQAEERLLPGAPPGEHLGSDNTQPSAPEAVDHEDFVYRYRLHQPLHPEPYPSVLATDLPQSSVQRQVGHQYSHGSSPILAGSSDDKRELEMRRLQLAATSPEEDGSGSSGTSPLPQPSAPVASDIEQPNDLDQPYSFDLREPGPPPSQSENNDAGESLPVYRRWKATIHDYLMGVTAMPRRGRRIDEELLLITRVLWKAMNKDTPCFSREQVASFSGKQYPYLCISHFPIALLRLFIWNP